MNLNVRFEESKQIFTTQLGEIHNVSDGGFERGYAEGYEKGNLDGYETGYETGYAEGETAGYEEGNTEGYNEGVEDGSVIGLEDLFLKNIKSFKSDKVVSVEQYTFLNCTELEELDVPSLTSVANSMCRGCVKLKKVRLLHMTGEVGSNAFQSCFNLEYADIGTATGINAAAFYDCRALSTLIIRTNNIVTIKQNFNGTFYNSPMINGKGSFYVPDNLVEAYKKDATWSTYASQVKPLSELEVS